MWQKKTLSKQYLILLFETKFGIANKFFLNINYLSNKNVTIYIRFYRKLNEAY